MNTNTVSEPTQLFAAPVTAPVPVNAAYAPLTEAIKGYMENRQALVEKLVLVSGNAWNGQDKQLKELRADIAVIDLRVAELLGVKK